MRLLIWQWGRRGAGPRFAAGLKSAFQALDGTEAVLSLSAQSELLRERDGPICEMPVSTYDNLAGFAVQWTLAPLRIHTLATRVRALRPDIALCAMSGPLDLLMATALKRIGIKFAVVVHDADPHPGDGFPLQMALQRALVRRADAVVTLTGHVSDRLRAQGLIRDGSALIRSRLPPFVFGPVPPAPRAHGGALRLLSFGRLLPYKGLDLLAEALGKLGPRDDLVVRIVGSGPESAALGALRALRGVTVENRWVPEGELAPLLAWADAMVLPYREASQSGAAAAAIAAGRWVIATRVGGMEEQLAGEPMVFFADPTAGSVASAIEALLGIQPHGQNRHGDAAMSWKLVAADLASALRPLRAVALR